MVVCDFMTLRFTIDINFTPINITGMRNGLKKLNLSIILFGNEYEFTRKINISYKKEKKNKTKKTFFMGYKSHYNYKLILSVN